MVVSLLNPADRPLARSLYTLLDSLASAFSYEPTVLQVSADRLASEQPGARFYKAEVEIDPADLARLEDIALYPGMPAEVLIQTGARTFADYLLRPILDSFARAFRED